MADKTWKQAERRVAKAFGTMRVPGSGSMVNSDSETRSDSKHPKLFLEIKQRARHSVWQLWRKTKALADREKKTPVVLLDQKRSPGFLVVVHSDDLENFINGYLHCQPSGGATEERLWGEMTRRFGKRTQASVQHTV